MNERFKQINSINTILLRAEQDIYTSTGLRMRLIVTPEQEQHQPPGGDPERLLRLIANAQGLAITDYHVRTRTSKYAYLRMLGAYFLKQYYPKLTLKKIGALVGGVDHTTVMYYLKEVPLLIETGEPAFMTRYEAVLSVAAQWMSE